MLRALAGGTPACVTVAHLDGLVLARSGFNHSANYRSVMCFGVARLVEDPAEKNQALLDVVDRFYPGRSATLRGTTALETKATTVIGMTIDEASAKTRAKGVADDEADYDHPVWAGVIPVRVEIGHDQPCERLRPGLERPVGLAAYRAGRRLDEALIDAQRRYETARPQEGVTHDG